jgi:hypothetical protein
MELDELKASWQHLDRRVQELTAINRRLSLDAAIHRARWRLAPLLASAAGNVLIGAFFALASASFIGSHRDALGALVPAVVLLATSLAYLVVGAGRLVLARRIDFSGPVLEIQRLLAAMQKWEAWSFFAMWTGCSLLPLAMLFAIIVATHGVASWARMPAVVVVNAILWITVGVVPLLAYLVSRRRQGKFVARVEAFLTSHSVAQARATLAEIDEFAER